jgi:beta-lactam-binding protein with PASTA domain
VLVTTPPGASNEPAQPGTTQASERPVTTTPPATAPVTTAPDTTDLVVVPNLMGLSAIEAENELTSRGLEGEGRNVVSHDRLLWTKVVAQNPAPGTQVENGSTVSYDVGQACC